MATAVRRGAQPASGGQSAATHRRATKALQHSQSPTVLGLLCSVRAGIIRTHCFLLLLVLCAVATMGSVRLVCKLPALSCRLSRLSCRLSPPSTPQ